MQQLFNMPVGDVRYNTQTKGLLFVYSLELQILLHMVIFIPKQLIISVVGLMIVRRGIKSVQLEVYLVSLGHNLYKFHNKQMKIKSAA